MAYVGSKGTHLLQESYVNVENPLTGLRPYPPSPRSPGEAPSATVRYNALSVSLKRNFSRGLLVSANYTWSHSIDDDSNGSGDGDSITAAECFLLAPGSRRNAGSAPAAPSTSATCSMRISSMSFLLVRENRTSREWFREGRC